MQFDGRFDTCYPQEVIDMHFDWLLGDTGPRDREPGVGADRRHARARVRASRTWCWSIAATRRPRRVMEAAAAGENPEWTLLYSDSVARAVGPAFALRRPGQPALPAAGEAAIRREAAGSSLAMAGAARSEFVGSGPSELSVGETRPSTVGTTRSP